ncbi:MAG: GlsB/YeaQ/YmgE family stress response membrane protein [Bacteroidales bacterium]|nr:GlsB/YeaQ/YmgE family stress response membrane protein [Bacteroidales bacterium]
MGMLVSILIGALAGIIAGKIMNYGLGLIWAIIVGVVGGFLGSWIFSIIGLPVSASFWGQLLVGTVGAVVLLWLVSKIKKK